MAKAIVPASLATQESLFCNHVDLSRKRGANVSWMERKKLPQQQQKQQPQEHHDQDLFLLQVAGKDLTGSTEPKDLRDKGHKYIHVMGLFYNSKSCTGMMPVVLVKL